MKRWFFAFAIATAAVIGGAALPPEVPVDHTTPAVIAPKLANTTPVVRLPVSSTQRMAKRHQLTPTARTKTYGRIDTHPLILKAADILSDRLRKYAAGVYITSLSRSPEDQMRLMRSRRTRYWATQRSKHLAGLAVDIGFVSRKKSTWALRDKAETILNKELGKDVASLLRVVRERHCIHVEIDTWRGKDIIAERRRVLENLGIVVAQADERPHPVPALTHYVPERIWTRTRAFLEPLPL